MKKIKLLRVLQKTIFTFLIGFMVFSCKKIENITYEEIKDDLVSEEKTPGENTDEVLKIDLGRLIAETEELSLLKEAIEKVKLNPIIATDEPITIFAPTNEAIEELFNLLGDEYDSFEDFDSLVELEILNRILMYHIVTGKLLSDNLATGELPTLYEGNSLEIISTESSFLVSDATAIDARPIVTDIQAVNGVLHGIDKILIPKDIVEFLGNSNLTNTSRKTIEELIVETEDFSLILEALTITGLLDTLGQEGPFTVFIPSNMAFFGLFNLLGDDFSNLEDFSGETEINLLREILQYHVLETHLESNDFVLGSVPTLSADNTIQIVEEEGNHVLVDDLHLESNFIALDIPAKNGTIHIIDKILTPTSVIDFIENEVSLAFERAMATNEDLNTSLDLFRAIEDTVDLRALADTKFTFFFPSDQAFDDLYEELGYDTIREFKSKAGIEIMKTILSYHCIENKAYKTTDFTEGLSLETFQGESLKVSLKDHIRILDKTGISSKIIGGDQRILKGYIHMVDKVLLPREVLVSLAK